MSSTNRGGKRSEADFYATPAWCVRRLIDAVDLPAGEWLEPCAGDGAIIRATVEYRALRTRKWTAVELREECRERLEDDETNVDPYIGDFFTSPLVDSEHIRRNGPQLSFDVILTNPPFSLAMEFIRACETIATHRIFLLRLNFLGSEERSSYIRDTKPDLYVLPNRPSFVGAGKTDSIEYAWFHWHPGSTGKYVILPSTPIEERKAKRP